MILTNQYFICHIDKLNNVLHFLKYNGLYKNNDKFFNIIKFQFRFTDKYNIGSDKIFMCNFCKENMDYFYLYNNIVQDILTINNSSLCKNMSFYEINYNIIKNINLLISYIRCIYNEYCRLISVNKPISEIKVHHHTVPDKILGYCDNFKLHCGEICFVRFTGIKNTNLKNKTTNIIVKDLVTNIEINITHNCIFNKDRLSLYFPVESHSGNGANYHNFFYFNTKILTPSLYLIIINDDLKSECSCIYVNIIPKLEETDYTLNKNILIGINIPIITHYCYNGYGGKSLYTDCSQTNNLRIKYSLFDTTRVSLNRPHPEFKNLAHKLESYINYLKILKKHKYNFVIIDDITLDNNKLLLNLCSLLITVGHSEYWTHDMIKNINQYIDNGGKWSIFAGNVMYWQVRVSYNNEIVLYRQMKKQIQNPIDPLIDTPLKTGFMYRVNIGEENYIGLASRFGGYSIIDHYKRVETKIKSMLNNKEIYHDDIENAKGMKIIKKEHPIFENINKQFLGKNIGLMGDEIDAIHCDANGNIDRAWLVNNKNLDITILATGWTTPCTCTIDEYIPNGKKNENVRLGGTIIEFNKNKGKIIHLGSIAWYRGILKMDNDIVNVYLNTIKYLLN